jgi:dihydropteroate synthase
MGILNVTPDSFSDGGRFLDTKAAVERGLEMIREGADIVDIGGESTRPGAAEVPPEEEMARVIPVIEELKKRTSAVISIDTMKAVVARQAVEAGARIINDVSALTHDADMPRVAKECGTGVILMHMQGTPRTMQKDPHYGDVVAEVSRHLKTRVDALVAAGLDRASLAVDPGIGFGKTVEHNVSLLAHLSVLTETGRPIVVGLSRKSFLGKLTGCEVGERLAPSLAALVFCVLNGAHIMRVHDVKESRQAVTLAMALDHAG